MRVVDVLERGIGDGTHVGAQLYVSHGGRVAADVAVGRARDGVEMRTDSMMTWFSMTKAGATAVAVAQQWERGALDVDDAAARHLPEFGANGKRGITIRHLLTHTAGLPNADGILQGVPWREPRAENLARIYAATPEYEPGTRAGYHAAAGMSVLGEVVARVSGVPFDVYVRDEIFGPLGMVDCWIGIPADRYEAYGDRIGHMHVTATGTPERVRGVDSARASAEPMPGGNGRGPMNQWGRFYEMLVGHGTREGVRVLSPVTVAAISARRYRTGIVDENYGVVMDWGLGLVVDWYATGRYSSRRAFGHGGHQSSVAFCDPEHDLVVAVVCNGMPGRERHQARLDAISSAVYVDLGIARPDDSGRAKPFPTLGL